MKILPIFAVNTVAYSDAWKGRGVTLTDLAKRCNMSKGQLSNLRSGRMPSPSVWTALRLADGLGVTIDDLVTDRPDRREAVRRRIFEGAADLSRIPPHKRSPMEHERDE